MRKIGGVRRNVGVVAVYHETNTFASGQTALSNFKSRWYEGGALLEHFKGTRTVVGGFIDGAGTLDWELVPILGTYATPSGTVQGHVLEAIEQAIKAQARGLPRLDGLLVELHGAMVVEGVNDTEEALISCIRSILPDTPVAVVLDLHSNMLSPRLNDVDILVGYRTNPHVDTYERGIECTSLLQLVLEKSLRPHRAHGGVDYLLPPIAQSTHSGPMRDLSRLADRLRCGPKLKTVSIHGGYAYADVPYAGIGFTATSDEAHSETAEQAVVELVDAAESLLRGTVLELPPAEEAVARAVAAGGLACVADTGDNINGGAQGNGTALLHAAFAHPDRKFLTTFADPSLLSQARTAGVGGTFHAVLRPSDAGFGETIEGVAEVVLTGDGRFVNRGPMATGARVDMNGAALIRMSNCDVLVQGAATQPNDPSMFTTSGIDPSAYDVLLLKGAAALRAGWGTLVDSFWDAGTPGETDSDLRRLSYRKARCKVPAPRFSGQVSNSITGEVERG